ncbi:hypothetical protein A8O14_02620 [Polynucleobacter wuianus]|uniref:Uncharacterized protein n=1 Tax=Polynucleobacter wuianus TaxID=1743168 RepID=A0A191UDQ1_9BURK|nr:MULTISPECIES: hypothetical protein [Polynucleobacter]ANI99082.1 hypothetical protein A8O14_02620 [Polynucleobacter wuianus]MBU3552347.1 hypothetical protein [Polynucleobacter sp. MWH-Post4-6-1]
MSRANSKASAEQSNPANFFEGVSIRPLDRLAHLIHEHGDTFSDKDLSGFNTILECEAHGTKELISMICGALEEVPNIDGDKVSFSDLYLTVQRLVSALSVANNKLSELSDLALVCSYANSKIEMRLHTLKGERS